MAMWLQMSEESQLAKKIIINNISFITRFQLNLKIHVFLKHPEPKQKSDLPKG